MSPNQTYTMTVNNFMASGGDDYAPFTEALEATDTGLIDSDVFADYLETLPRPIATAFRTGSSSSSPGRPPGRANEPQRAGR